MTDKTDDTAKFKQLVARRMKFSEAERIIFSVTVSKDVTREDLLKPAFWGQVAHSFQPWKSRIEVLTDEGDFYAELIVVACDRTWAKVKELLYVDLSGDMPELKPEDEYEYKHMGPHWGHCIMRKSDNEPIQKNCQSKDAALKWLNDYKRTIAA